MTETDSADETDDDRVDDQRDDPALEGDRDDRADRESETTESDAGVDGGREVDGDTDSESETVDERERSDRLDVLDRDDVADDQLPLAAFDESTSKRDLVREVIDVERDRNDDLNAIGDAVAALETVVDGEPLVEREDWRDVDADLKRRLVELRLAALVDDVEDAIATDAETGDDLRPETDRSNVGYW